MKKYLLDTDICIYFLKGKHNIKSKIEEVGISNCYISEITIAELAYGAFNSEQFEKHINEVLKMQTLFEILPINNALIPFGQEKARLKKSGNLIPDFDLLIGITAIQNEMILVSNNEKHLSRINNIKLENWVKV
jgi:tRNA(fMet)-specific endonuclease VapC